MDLNDIIQIRTSMQIKIRFVKIHNLPFVNLGFTCSHENDFFMLVAANIRPRHSAVMCVMFRPVSRFRSTVRMLHNATFAAKFRHSENRIFFHNLPFTNLANRK